MTVGQMLDALERRSAGKTAVTLIVDRRMAYRENLDEIRGRGYHHIKSRTGGFCGIWRS